MPRELVVPSPGEGGNIQPALDSALTEAGTGDIVILPAGNYWLEGEIRVHGSDRGGFTLRGHGKNQTRLFKRGRNKVARCMLTFEDQSGIEVKGITFEGAPSAVLDEKNEHDDIGLCLTRCTGFTIHHCRFTSFGHAGVQVRHAPDAADGLVYNNEFIDNHFPNPRPDPIPDRDGVSSLGYGVEIRAELPDGADPDIFWLPLPALDGTDFIFIEDNYFSGHRHAIAAGEGGLYVFRHNLVDRCLKAHAVDAHGAGKYGNRLSTRFYQVYYNTLTSATLREATARGFQLPNFAMAFRGGEGVIFENNARGFPNGIRLAVEVPAPGYPVKFQIGWESATNHMPNPDPEHRGLVPREWGLGDVFLWDNEAVDSDGVGVTPIHVGSGDSHLLIENRDFHLGRRPEYHPPIYPHPRAVSPDRLAFPYPFVASFESRLRQYFAES